MRGRNARLLRALGAGTRTTVSGVPVDRAPDGLPDDLEFRLDESDGGGLGGKDAMVEVLVVPSEERF